MHAHLVSYLKDNRDQVIENWLTEVEIPAPAQSAETDSGTVPFEFFTTAFDTVLELIEHGAQAKETYTLHLNRFLGITCDCREHSLGGRICIELHESGLQAFMSVFDEDWDAQHEFSKLDRECSKGLINQALSRFFGKEIDLCERKALRNDCPFVAHN